MKKAIFAGFNALGDTLCTTPVIRAFRKLHPDIFIIYIVQNAGFCRVLNGNPDIDLVLYSEKLYLNGTGIMNHEWLGSLPLDLTETANLYHFDINGVCSRPESFQEHISVGFSRLLDIPIESTRPIIHISRDEQRLAEHFTPRPYLVFSPHSVSNPARADGTGRAKDWPVERWLRLAETIHAWGDFDIIAVGSEWDQQIRSPHIRNLYGLPIKIVAALLQNSLCVITLENGIAHLGTGVHAPMVIIYSDVVPLAWACPEESDQCRVLYGDPMKLGHHEVMDAVRSVACIQ